MELKCPQCGKNLTVSQEELVIHDSQVVCPQCLAVCCYDGNGLVVRNDSDAPYRHTATVKNVKHENSRFCHNCGKQLPGGISFCPYCGADLKAPFIAEQHTSSTPEPKPVEKAKSEQPAKEEKKPQSASKQSKPSSSVENKLRTIPRHYSSEHPRLHQHGTKPSTTFKVIAYIVIVLLLMLLVGIIIAGLNIEPSI